MTDRVFLWFLLCFVFCMCVCGSPQDQVPAQAPAQAPVPVLQEINVYPMPTDRNAAVIPIAQSTRIVFVVPILDFVQSRREKHHL